MNILLLDANWNQTAYLVAELAAAGATVTVAAPTSPWPRGLGRYCRQVRSPEIHATAYPRFLDDLLSAENPDLIFPTCEPLQQLMWDRAERDESLPVFPRVTRDQRDTLADRRKLYAFADGLGVRTPRSLELPNDAALQGALDRFGLPCVIRGTQGMSGEQVRIVNDSVGAQLAWRELRDSSPGTPFAQEFLEGQRCLVGGLFDNGRPLAMFSQTTLECCPAPIGPSIRVRSMSDPLLLRHAEVLFDALRWNGLACAEFIRIRPEEYGFLEINPRPWAAVNAASECGVPLLRLFARYLLGKRPEVQPPLRDGIECTLFPAFLIARMQTDEFPHLRDLRAYMQLVRAIPWRRPSLVLQFARNIIWTCDAVRRRAERVAGGPKVA